LAKLEFRPSAKAINEIADRLSHQLLVEIATLVHQLVPNDWHPSLDQSIKEVAVSILATTGAKFRAEYGR
jgi:hypothetical protein